MCLIALAWKAHPRWPLVLIANRDEYHARPTAPAGPHPEASDVYGGRDLEKGGSWLLVSARRRLAAVTNVRDGVPDTGRPRSRGALVDAFARGDMRAEAFAAGLGAQASGYGRFNLLLWDGEALHFATNHPRFEHFAVTPGLHAMSNGAFDAPWPKAAAATRRLQAWLDAGGVGGATPLFEALADQALAEDALLPDTGVGRERERLLSPVFILGRDYGTRSSAVVRVEAAGLQFEERRFGPGGERRGESRTAVPWAAPRARSDPTGG